MEKLTQYLNTHAEKIKQKTFHSQWQLNKEGDKLCFSGNIEDYRVYFMPTGTKDMKFICSVVDGVIIDIDMDIAKFLFSDLVA